MAKAKAQTAVSFMKKPRKKDLVFMQNLKQVSLNQAKITQKHTHHKVDNGIN